MYIILTTNPLTVWFGQMLFGRQAAFWRLCHFWRWLLTKAGELVIAAWKHRMSYARYHLS